MGRNIIATFEVDEEDIKEFMEDTVGYYDESEIYTTLNCAVDDLPFCMFLRGYHIEED